MSRSFSVPKSAPPEKILATPIENTGEDSFLAPEHGKSTGRKEGIKFAVKQHPDGVSPAQLTG